MTADDRQALKRIAARLLGLADLAERASRRPLFVQLLVLWILRFAEAHARNLVVSAARDFGYQAHLPSCFVDDIAPMILGSHGNRSAGALRLAMSFEMLAALLSDLIELASRDGQGFRPDILEQFLSGMQRAALLADAAGRFAGAAGGGADQRPHIIPYALARAPPS